ncbi:unnamed protein product [Scytosiphon promiscuus]
MASLRAAYLALVAALVALCRGVSGFTAPTAVGTTATSFSRRSTSTSSPIRRGSLHRTQQTQRRSRHHPLALQAAGGEDDGIEEYKKQMAEFMAQAHEKRLQAMEAVKAEVQRGYEEQIADLQSKLAALPEAAGGDVGREPQLVGAGTGPSTGSAAGSGSTIGSQQHPGYAARSTRPGWGSRWGSEESVRASPAMATADAVSAKSAVTSTTTPNGSGGAAHPAYVARAQRPGWEARWGHEEVSRPGGGVSISAAETHSPAAAESAATSAGHPAYAAREQRPGWEVRWGNEEAERAGGGGRGVSASISAAAGAQADVHPAYAARSQRSGWEARWGSEEPARMVAATISSAVAPTSAGAEATVQVQGEALTTPADAHPAYAARVRRPGWEARWGTEEPARMATTATSTPDEAATLSSQAESSAAAAAAVAAPADAHPAYAARAQRPGWEARWGVEEPARMASAATAIPTPGGGAEAQIASAEQEEESYHPAYAARSRRSGWEARWGVEEKERVEGAAAGAVAVAGAAAGFATAGGLDAPAAGGMDVASAAADADYLEDDFLPDDVGALRQMVVSNRRHFQEYLLKSLEASNELRQSKAALERELSSSTAELNAEQHLRESVQESFLGYMSRSGEALATEKARIADLEKKLLMLATEADELKSFTQGYMVKASSEKQYAVEEATADARAQAAERIAALQAQVLELQAGG